MYNTLQYIFLFYLFIRQGQFTLISITANLLEFFFFIHCPWTDVNIVYLKRNSS